MSGGPVEIKFVKSSYSGGTDCVEVGLDPATGDVAVRNSRTPGVPPHVFTAAEWDAFLDGAAEGQFQRDRLPR